MPEYLYLWSRLYGDQMSRVTRDSPSFEFCAPSPSGFQPLCFVAVFVLQSPSQASQLFSLLLFYRQHAAHGSESFKAITLHPVGSCCLWPVDVSHTLVLANRNLDQWRNLRRSMRVCSLMLIGLWSRMRQDTLKALFIPQVNLYANRSFLKRSVPEWNTRTQKDNFRVLFMHLFCLCTTCWCSKQINV